MIGRNQLDEMQELLAKYELLNDTNLTAVNNHLDSIEWIIKQFNSLASSQLVKETNQFQETFDLIIELSEIQPKNIIDEMIIEITNAWERQFYIKTSQTSIIEYVNNNGLKLAFLKEVYRHFDYIGIDLLQKIHSTVECQQHEVAITVALAALKKLVDPLLFTDIHWLCKHAQFAKQLYLLFSQIENIHHHSNPDFAHLKMTQSFLNKILHPNVLNNLDIVNHFALHNELINHDLLLCRKYNFELNEDNRKKNNRKKRIDHWHRKLEEVIDDIIELGNTWRYVDVFDFAIDSNDRFHTLPKELISSTVALIPLRQLDVAQATAVLAHITPWRERLSLPLTDNMVDDINDDELDVLGITLKNVDVVFDTNYFKKLSTKALITLFDKLGREFVVEKIFKSKRASTLIHHFTYHLDTDSKKAFFTWLGEDYVKKIVGQPTSYCHFLLVDQNTDIFPFIFNLLGSVDFAVEFILNVTKREESKPDWDGLSWDVIRCYYLLEKIGKLNPGFLEQILEKLGREWIISTIHSRDKLCTVFHGYYYKNEFDNPAFRYQILDLIGHEHLKKLYPNCKSITKLFTVNSNSNMMNSSIILYLFDKLGKEYLLTLMEPKEARQILLYNLVAWINDDYFLHQLFDFFQVDDRFIKESFFSPEELFQFLHFFNPEFLREKLHKSSLIMDRFDAVILNLSNQFNARDLNLFTKYLPHDYYPTLVNHLSAANNLPDYKDILENKYLVPEEDRLFWFMAQPFQGLSKELSHDFEKVLALINLLNHGSSSKCSKVVFDKLSCEQLQAIFTNSDLLLEISDYCSKEAFTLLLNKLGIEHLNKMIPDQDKFTVLIKLHHSFQPILYDMLQYTCSNKTDQSDVKIMQREGLFAVTKQDSQTDNPKADQTIPISRCQTH